MSTGFQEGFNVEERSTWSSSTAFIQEFETKIVTLNALQALIKQHLYEGCSFRDQLTLGWCGANLVNGEGFWNRSRAQEVQWYLIFRPIEDSNQSNAIRTLAERGDGRWLVQFVVDSSILSELVGGKCLGRGWSSPGYGWRAQKDMKVRLPAIQNAFERFASVVRA
jgi:hypothetical protein